MANDDGEKGGGCGEEGGGCGEAGGHGRRDEDEDRDGGGRDDAGVCSANPVQPSLQTSQSLSMSDVTALVLWCLVVVMVVV